MRYGAKTWRRGAVASGWRSNDTACPPAQVLLIQTSWERNSGSGPSPVRRRAVSCPEYHSTHLDLRPETETPSFKGSHAGFLGTLGSHSFPLVYTTLPSSPGMMPLPAISSPGHSHNGVISCKHIKKAAVHPGCCHILWCNISAHCINDPLQITHFLTNH